MSATARPDFRAFFERSPGLYLVLDPDLEIVAASDAYCEATYTKREDIVGRGIFEAFPDNPENLEATGVKNLRASLARVSRDRVADTMAPQRYDICVPSPDGDTYEVRYWSPISAPILGERNELQYIVHGIEDVTEFVLLQISQVEREQVKYALEERTQRMEAEVLRRSQELQVANAKLRSASSAKDEFLSRMSHELRTPLNSVLGFTQLLSRESLTVDQHESVNQIQKAGELLLELINEVIDVSRIATGRMSLSLEPVGVEDAVAEAVALIGPMADAAGVTIEVEDAQNLHVRADRQRFKQVLLNLFANAVKYNREGGTVVIGWKKGRENRLRVKVIDTGIGIAPEQMSRLFDPFDRLGAEGTGVEGTGLGLPLARGLVEAMGGLLTVESERGVGSVFTIDFELTESPLEHYERTPRVQKKTMVGTQPAATVLYIEDNLANLRLVERILADNAQVEVMSAMQGRLGIALAREHRPAIILLDLHLPDMGGEAVLQALRERPETRDIPVVVMSADATPGTVQRLRDGGVSEYLTKPFDIDTLTALVDRACAAAGPAVVQNHLCRPMSS